MRKLNGLILISALIMACSAVNAQMRIVIDGQQIPTEHIASIVILPNSNEINVATTIAYDVSPATVGDNVSISSFTSSVSTVLAGQAITFNWNTVNAVSCEATGGVDGWAGTSITIPAGNATITAATVGTHTFTLTCNGSEANDTDTRNVSVTISPADAVAITSFSADPDSISVGDTTTISWNTVNAESCTPTGGTADWTSQQIALPSGSANITLDSEGSYAFGLTCTGPSGDQQSESDLVTVSPDVQSCDTVTLSGNTTNWGTFWNSSFPGPSYENVTNQLVSRTGYLAIEFNTGSVIDDGKISALENSSTPGIRTGSISQCPGDFTEVPAECTYVWGLGGGIRWATNGKFGACDLEPNTTYYFNITFTDGEDPNSTTCNSAPCRINLQHVNL